MYSIHSAQSLNLKSNDDVARVPNAGEDVVLQFEIESSGYVLVLFNHSLDIAKMNFEYHLPFNFYCNGSDCIMKQ